MLFQQFSDVALLVGISKFKHFLHPVALPRQVSKILKRRVRNRTQKMYRKSVSKGFPNGPQKLTKIDKKRVQEGSQKLISKRYTLQDQGK